MKTATVLQLPTSSRSNAHDFTEEMVLESIAATVESFGLQRFAYSMTFAGEIEESTERLAA